MDKYLLALDQSSQTTGYAVFKNDNLIDHGAITFTGEIDQRIVKLRKWVLDQVNKFPPEDYKQVAIEDIQLQNLSSRNTVGVTTYKKLAWVQGALIEAFTAQSIPYIIVPPSTWRSYCGIKPAARAAQKAAAQDRVKQVYEFSASEDEADAICLGESVVGKIV